jgi:hypothetical protein
VYLVLGTIWGAYAALTFVYDTPALQNIGRVVMMAGVFIMLGAVLFTRLFGRPETPSQGG